MSSKVSPPVTRRGSVVRTALIERLRAAADTPVVAVTGPAGYGKTTLLRQWDERDPRPFAWVLLDEQDNDPSVLLTYLALAVEPIVPMDAAVYSALRSPRHSTATVVSMFLRALEHINGSAVLVLDDVHAVRSQESLDVLAQVVAQLPAGWQVALAGREAMPLPTPRLRVEGRMTELSTIDLAMDDDEAGQLLAAAGTDLHAHDVTAVNTHVEGWPAALYLAALAMLADRSVDPVAGSAMGTDRFVADYITSEVLSALSAEDVDFLVRTSFLDRLSGPLCDAVLARRDSADRLTQLERSNLLVTPLDHHRDGYRVHHVLRVMLRAERERLDIDDLRAMRRRAADWYEEHDVPELAVEQAMALDDAERVAALARVWGQRFYQRGRAVTARRWFAWIDARDILQDHPELACVGALMYIVDGHPAAAERWLDAAEQGVARDGTSMLRGRLALLRALACRDGAAAARRDAEQAVALLRPRDPFHGLSHLVLGLALVLAGDPDRADTAFVEAVESAEDGGASPALAIALAERALLALRRQQVTEARILAGRACQVVDEQGMGDYAIMTLVFAAAARTALADGDADHATRCIARAQRVHPYLTHTLPHYTVQSRVELARCYVAHTDVAGARTLLREALDIVRRRPRLGVLVDEIDELQHQLDDLRSTMAGASSLTSAELRLLPLLSTHLTFREVGERLFISPNTVKTEAIAIYRKLGVSSRSEAIARARALGLLA